MLSQNLSEFHWREKRGFCVCACFCLRWAFALRQGTANWKRCVYKTAPVGSIHYLLFLYIYIYIYPFFSPLHYIVPFTKIVLFRGFLRKLSILSHRIVYSFAVGFSLCGILAIQLALITSNTKDCMRLYLTVKYKVSLQVRLLNVWDSLAFCRNLIAIVNPHVMTTSLLTFQWTPKVEKLWRNVGCVFCWPPYGLVA